MEDAIEGARYAVGILDFHIANTHCLQATSNPADVQPVLETVIIRKESFIVMHMVCGTIVLNPNSLDSPNSPVEGRFKTKRESAKDCIVRGGSVVIGVGKIRCVSVVTAVSTPSAASMSSSPPSAATPFLWVLGFSSFLCEILFGG